MSSEIDLHDPEIVPTRSDGLPLPQRYLAIGALCCGTALIIIDGGIANVALPSIARDLKVDSSSVVAIVTVYQLMLVMLLLPFAGLGERIGLKRMYQVGQLIFTVATLLCFFAKSLPFLLVVRAAQAIGAAGALSVSSALIRSTYPSKQLGRGLGINSVIVSSSAAAAPTIGGLVLAIAPWPWCSPARSLRVAQPCARPRTARSRAAPRAFRPARRCHVRGDVRAGDRRRGKRGPWQ